MRLGGTEVPPARLLTSPRMRNRRRGITHRRGRQEATEHLEGKAVEPVARPPNVRPTIKEIQTNGISSLRSVAKALNARGGEGTGVQVSNVLAR